MAPTNPRPRSRNEPPYEQDAKSPRPRCALAQGNLISKPTLPQPTLPNDFKAMSASTLYLRSQNEIYDVTTNAVLWTGPLPTGGKGAPASGFVVFPYQLGVYAAPH